MPVRKKHKEGGRPAPSLAVKLDDSQVQQLQGELRKQQEVLIGRRDALDEANLLLHDAQREYDATESRHLAGRVDDRALALARAALDDAKKRHATAAVNCEETERLVSEILPAAITEAKNAALAELRDTLRRETQTKAKALAALLAEAKVLSDDLRLLHDAAVRHFTVFSMIHLRITLMGRLDLGEFGWVAPYAGVPNLACGWLTGQSVNQPTMFDVWQRELAAYLEKTPEAMAQEDVACRETMLARDERDYKEALVRQAAQEKLEQMLEARAGGAMPKGTQLLD